MTPELNPVENIWISLVRLVYANGNQFNNVNELKEKIKESGIK